MRNTEFTRAPNTSARAHPNVFFDHFFGDICEEEVWLRICFDKSSAKTTYFYRQEGDYDGDNITQHVKTVSHQSHRVRNVSYHELHNEKPGG